MSYSTQKRKTYSVGEKVNVLIDGERKVGFIVGTYNLGQEIYYDVSLAFKEADVEKYNDSGMNYIKK